MTGSPRDPTTPLSIAVIGVGGIGSTFALQLARAGHGVTVVARPGSERLRQLRRDGGVVRATGEQATMQVADRLDEEVIYDLVLVTTLAHQVDALLPALQASRARWIQFMFNTFEPDRLLKAVGAQRCSFGMPFVMGSLDAEGRLQGAIPASRKTLHGDRRCAALFEDAGLPSAFEPDMPLWLRCNTPMCIAMESISVMGQKRGGGASWREAMAVAGGVRAGYAILKGLGTRPYPSSKAMIAAAPAPALAAMLWSVSRNKPFRELLATGAAECRALIDTMAEAATASATPQPQAVRALRAIAPPERGPSTRG